MATKRKLNYTADEINERLEQAGEVEGQAVQIAQLEDAIERIPMDVVPDYRELPLLCGQPPILYGAGTPQESIVPTNWKQFDPETGKGYNWNGTPSALGQQYINTSASTGGRYIAYDSGNGNLAWKNF